MFPVLIKTLAYNLASSSPAPSKASEGRILPLQKRSHGALFLLILFTHFPYSLWEKKLKKVKQFVTNSVVSKDFIKSPLTTGFWWIQLVGSLAGDWMGGVIKVSALLVTTCGNLKTCWFLEEGLALYTTWRPWLSPWALVTSSLPGEPETQSGVSQ